MGRHDCYDVFWVLSKGNGADYGIRHTKTRIMDQTIGME